jgi:hypothetical protein
MYSADKKSIKKPFESLEECENHYKNMIIINEKILRLSKTTNDNDDISIAENTFFKSFCYNEYQHQVFNTGFDEHLEIILKNAGFEIESIGELKKLEKQEKQDMNEIYDMMIEGSFDEFVNLKYKDINSEDEFKIIEKELNTRFKIYNERNNLLNLSTKEETNNYKELILDEFRLLKYFNVLNLFKTDDYIKTKLKTKTTDGYKVKTVSSIFNKIALIERFEKHYKIDRLDLDMDKIKCDIEIDDKFKMLYKSLFPKKTAKNYNLELIEKLTKIKPDEKPKNIIKGFIECDTIEEIDLYDEDDIVTNFKFGKI